MPLTVCDYHRHHALGGHFCTERQPATMKLSKTTAATVLFTSLSCSAGTPHIKTLHPDRMVPGIEDRPLYAKIVEVDGTYTFDEFAYLKPPKAGPWVDLGSGRPTWKHQGSVTCGAGLFYDKNFPVCRKIKRPDEFINVRAHKKRTALRLAVAPLTLGLSLLGFTGEVKFREEDYQRALEEAWNGASPVLHQVAALGPELDERIERLNREIEETATELRGIDPNPVPANRVSQIRFRDPVEISRTLDGVEQQLRVEADAGRRRALALYRQRFSAIDSPAEANAFVSLYRGRFDPDVVVPQVENMVQEYQAQAQQAKLAERQRQAEERLRQKKEVAQFRQRVAAGDSSNCGLVIEVKRNDGILQVQAMIGSVWIELEKIFPSGYECTFVNGVYRPPLLSSESGGRGSW